MESVIDLDGVYFRWYVKVEGRKTEKIYLFVEKYLKYISIYGIFVSQAGRSVSGEEGRRLYVGTPKKSIPPCSNNFRDI